MQQSRIEIEKNYHNEVEWEEPNDPIFRHKIIPKIIDEYVDELLGDLSGKIILEIGCGGGKNLIRFAEKGAIVYGIDISEKAVENCEKITNRSAYAKKITISVGDVHNLAFKDQFADLVFGNAILHHLDLVPACEDIYRCLKPGGKAVFVEPLGHNPIINLFRRMTPERRTVTECPLKWADIDVLKKRFRVSHKEFFCFSLAAYLLVALHLDRSFERVFRVLYNVETSLRLDKLLNKQCWITVLSLEKRE